jgi:hypothetical protein
MATLRFTFNPYSIANEILPNTASIYRAGIQPAKKKSSLNKERIIQYFAMYVLYWS